MKNVIITEHLVRSVYVDPDLSSTLVSIILDKLIAEGFELIGEPVLNDFSEGHKTPDNYLVYTLTKIR